MKTQSKSLKSSSQVSWKVTDHVLYHVVIGCWQKWQQKGEAKEWPQKKKITFLAKECPKIKRKIRFLLSSRSYVNNFAIMCHLMSKNRISWCFFGNKVTKLVPKSSPPKKLAQSVVDACANLFQRAKSTISLLLFPVPGRLMGTFPRSWGKRYRRDPFSFFKCFLYGIFWLDEHTTKKDFELWKL